MKAFHTDSIEQDYKNITYVDSFDSCLFPPLSPNHGGAIHRRENNIGGAD